MIARLLRRLAQRIGRVEVLGVILAGLFLVVSGLSRQFVYGQGHLDRPILAVVAWLLAAFIVYGLAVWIVLRRPQTVRLGTVLLFAVLFRLVLLASNVIQEDDLYRYVWDGQVSRAGISPYRYAPADAPSALAPLRDLASRHPDVAARVNHPGAPTIYPPVAQAVFALTQWAAPWSLRGVRVMAVAFDGLCALLVIAILKQLALPPSRVLIYAWSPLVLKEFANSGHMDAIAMVGVLWCVLMVISRRWVLAGAGLAVAVAGKYYPLALIPVLLGHLWGVHRRAFAAGIAGLLVTLAVCFAPALRDGPDVFRGVGVYAGGWRMNEGLFGVLAWGGRAIAGPSAESLARVFAALLFLGVIGWILRLPPRHGHPALGLTWRMLLVTGALVLLSPAAFPWYLAWLIPLLCLHPSGPWLLLTGSAQLYYLGFFVEYHYPAAAAQALWTAIKLAEYLPFYGVAAWSIWRFTQQQRRPAPLAVVPA